MVRLKYSVAAVSPPVSMPFASCTDIFFTASTSSCFASGTAASAARFMVSTSSSACLPHADRAHRAFDALHRAAAAGS